MATVRRSPAPRWYGIPFRVLLVTFIGTLVCFAVALLLGIVGTVIVASLRHTQPNMRIAYQQIALPMAATAGSGWMSTS